MNNIDTISKLCNALGKRYGLREEGREKTSSRFIAADKCGELLSFRFAFSFASKALSFKPRSRLTLPFVFLLIISLRLSHCNIIGAFLLFGFHIGFDLLLTFIPGKEKKEGDQWSRME